MFIGRDLQDVIGGSNAWPAREELIELHVICLPALRMGNIDQVIPTRQKLHVRQHRIHKTLDLRMTVSENGLSCDL